MEDDHIEEVQLDLESEEPPAPQTKPEFEAAQESDPATEAFARLEGEMAMVRHTVQNMARERADIVIPDYTARTSCIPTRGSLALLFPAFSVGSFQHLLCLWHLRACEFFSAKHELGLPRDDQLVHDFTR